MPRQFRKDVERGLSGAPKTLPSKYFYDKKGGELFVEIMNLPEYYLTRAEHEIFKEQSEAIIQAFEISPEQHFELVELGPGDGTKTKELLSVLSLKDYQFEYLPIDISQNALDQLEKELASDLPGVSVRKKQGDYFTMLASLRETHHPKILFFLGSNLGNMTDRQATKFIYRLGSNLAPNDILLLGVDLIKPAGIVLPAYNDPAGLTRAFNLNLLSRINRELGGNFNISNFTHLPEYTAETGIARSYLVSSVEQTVTLNGSSNAFHFAQGERILTEISRKYDDEIIKQIIHSTDFRISNKFTDKNGLFADYILKRA